MSDLPKPSPSTLTPSSKILVPEHVTDYTDPEISTRRWELAINYKTKVYLTDQERDYFLRQVAMGMTIIQVGALTLSNRLDAMIPVRGKSRPFDPKLGEEIMERERQRMRKLGQLK